MSSQFDLSGYSLAELEAMLTQIPKLIKSKQQTDRAKLVKQIQDLVSDHGFTMEDLFGKQIKKPLKSYRHPKLHHIVWSGFGRRPQWVLLYLEQGGNLEDLAFDPAAKV